MPGRPINKVRIMLIQKCFVTPTCKKAATGGRMIQKMTFTTFIALLLRQ
jgi:hypothetical protein